MTKASRKVRPFSEPLERRRLLASASTLLQYDFSSTAWQQSPGALSTGVTATLAQGGYGTIDTEGSTTTSGAMRLTVDSAPTTPWSADLTSGQLAVTNTETNLGKLTLAFSLSTSQAKPVKVIVSSYNSAGQLTGALQTQINPAASYSYQRYALDLSTMTASGSGAFNPTAPKISFDFEMNSQAGWSTATPAQLRLDNVNYAKPAYYVSALTGNNSFNGKTEQTAFATPQTAINLAQPGDVIVLMNGTYNGTSVNSGAIHFTKGGTPAAWVTVKNYPGQSPVIYNEAWNAISIGSSSVTSAAAVAYVEIRGLHVQGDSAKVGLRSAPDGPYDSSQPAGTYGGYGPLINASNPQTNGNGIGIDGRKETNKPHDIRIADNWVEDCAGAGIGAGDCDRVQIENNLVQDNCYWDIYATSGISVLSAYNFDGTSGSYTRLVRNNICSGNIHKEMWASQGKYSDGNGIIIDINKYAAVGNPGDADYTPALAALGRTLVTNNICYDNGGSGIHSFTSDHVDIVNNVAYLNSASDKLQYGEIFASGSSDVRIYNNIAVAPVAASGKPSEPINSGTSSFFKNNVYFGGNTAPVLGTGDVKADPKFVLASVDKTVADFHLQSTSPAINLGTAALAPNLDLAGNPHYGNPDAGVYEFIPNAPTTVALTAASDTGTAGDNKTRLNNANASSKLAFTITGTLSGATVSLYSGTTLLGTATATGTTTTVATDGVTALADGLATITARQTFAGAPSAASPSLGITVDATRPTLVGTPSINAGALTPNSRSQVNTITWTFSEPVVAALSSFVLTNLDTGQLVSLASRLVSIAGKTVTITLDRYGIDSGAGLFLANGNYELALSPTVTDTAGNALDANGDGTPGETPVINFFKLLCDYNGDRHVDFTDFLALQSSFGTASSSATFNPHIDHDANGVIDFSDFLTLQAAFGSSVPVPPTPLKVKYIRRPTPVHSTKPLSVAKR